MFLVENFMRNLFLKKTFLSMMKYKGGICKILRGPFFMTHPLHYFPNLPDDEPLSKPETIVVNSFESPYKLTLTHPLVICNFCWTFKLLFTIETHIKIHSYLNFDFHNILCHFITSFIKLKCLHLLCVERATCQPNFAFHQF